MVDTASWYAQRIVLRDGAIVVALSAAFGLGANAFRSPKLALIQKTPYETLVPCPEYKGNIAAIQPADPLVQDMKSLLVDARSREDFDAWHAPRAINIPFDYLAATPDAQIRGVVSSGSQRVIVYGDGEDPDSGAELARELATKGIRNVFYLAGGAPLLRKPTNEEKTP